jgi:hypothetical protein
MKSLLLLLTTAASFLSGGQALAADECYKIQPAMELVCKIGERDVRVSVPEQI